MLDPDKRVVSTELILKEKVFSPQKSEESVDKVQPLETVSLKVKFKLLVIFYPAKVTKFYTCVGPFRLVNKQGLVTYTPIILHCTHEVGLAVTHATTFKL